MSKKEKLNEQSNVNSNCNCVFRCVCYCVLLKLYDTEPQCGVVALLSILFAGQQLFEGDGKIVDACLW